MHDPLKARAQSVLGQFEDARPLINEPSSVGVPLLAPMTPIGVPSAVPLSKLNDSRNSNMSLFNSAVQSRSTNANRESHSPHSQGLPCSAFLCAYDIEQF